MDVSHSRALAIFLAKVLENSARYHFIELRHGEAGAELVGHEELDERNEVVVSPLGNPEDLVEVSIKGVVHPINRGNIPYQKATLSVTSIQHAGERSSLRLNWRD